MDKITQEDISPQTERELTSPVSPKRLRTDCSMIINHSGKGRIDFPKLSTFWKSVGSPSSKSLWQKNADLLCAIECGDVEYQKPHEQQETKLIVIPITKMTASDSDSAHTGSSKPCFITAERSFLLLVKDERLRVTESDKLSSCTVDDAGGALVESHTSNDTSADTSSHPDCKPHGESLEDESRGGCNLPAGNGVDGLQVQNSVSQIQAFTHSSSDEEVRCQSDCTRGDMLPHSGFCNTRSQSAEVEESNQERDERGFSEKILFSEEEEEQQWNAGVISFYSNPEEGPSGNLAKGVKNEERILELQICENENVAVCDGKTKGQVNENGLSKNFIPSAAGCAEGSDVSYDVVLAGNIAIENVRLEGDDFWGAKAEHAAGNVIAKAQTETADHTTETPMPARISQEPAEGDNDGGPFSVIDPAIWREADREAEEKHSNTESAAGAELCPSVKVCEMEMPLPLCSDVRPSQEVSAPDQTWQLNHQSTAQQCKDEKEDLCQSYTEPQACTMTTNETHNETGNEGSCLWKSSHSSSPKPPPAGAGRQESHDTVGHQLKDQDQSSCFPVSLDQQKTQEVEYLETEIARMKEATEIKEREEISFEEKTRTDEYVESENSVDSEQGFLQQNEKYKEDMKDMTEISVGACVSDWTEGEMSKHANKLTHIDKEMENNFASFPDDPTRDITPLMQETLQETERKEEASIREENNAQGNSEILVPSEDGYQQRRPQRGDVIWGSPDKCTSEQAEDNMNKKGNILSTVGRQERGNNLSCFTDCQHKAETFMAENKDDLLAFTFPTTSDAVVPSQLELICSQNADNNPTALNCSDRFFPVPSALTVRKRVPGGFDTFEKIHLSLHDDDEDDAGLSSSPVLTSLPGQLLRTPQRQLYDSMPEADTIKHEVVAKEEEVGEEEAEGLECHTENMANGFLSSDYSCNELPNFISAADVTALGWPDQQPNSEPACNSSECSHDDMNAQSLSSAVRTESDSPAPDVNDSPEFEMKKQFDMVLRELNLYFEISMSDFASDIRASSPKQRSDVTEVLEDDSSNRKGQLSSLECSKDTSLDDANDDCSPDVCGGDPVASCTSGSGDSEQEVPLGGRACQDASMHTAEKHREPREKEQKRKPWSPSFLCRPFLEQLNHRPPEQPRRLEPLRTCKRPIRVGLSKKAKTKHLHRPHPYK